jgi:hypothetical protein
VQRGESGTRIYSYKRIQRGARLKDHEREGKGRGVNVAPSSRCYRSTPYFMQARSTASPSTWTSPTSIPLLPNMCLRFVGDFSVVLPSLMRKGLVLAIGAISENLRPVWLRIPMDSQRRHHPSNVRPQNSQNYGTTIFGNDK